MGKARIMREEGGREAQAGSNRTSLGDQKRPQQTSPGPHAPTAPTFSSSSRFWECLSDTHQQTNSHPSAWALPSQGLTISCTGVSALLSLCAQHCPSPVPFPVPSALWPLCPGPSWGFRGPSFLYLPSEHGSPRLCHHSGPLCSRRPSQVHSGLSLFR